VVRGEESEVFERARSQDWDEGVGPKTPAAKRTRWHTLVEQLLSEEPDTVLQVPYNSAKELKSYRIAIGRVARGQNYGIQTEFRRTKGSTDEKGVLLVRSAGPAEPRAPQPEGQEPKRPGRPRKS
jgi:hypothetical protein